MLIIKAHPIMASRANALSTKNKKSKGKLSRYLPVLWSIIHTAIEAGEYKAHLILPIEEFVNDIADVANLKGMMEQLDSYLRNYGFTISTDYHRTIPVLEGGIHRTQRIKCGFTVHWGYEEVTTRVQNAVNIERDIEG